MINCKNNPQIQVGSVVMILETKPQESCQGSDSLILARFLLLDYCIDDERDGVKISLMSIRFVILFSSRGLPEFTITCIATAEFEDLRH